MRTARRALKKSQMRSQALLKTHVEMLGAAFSQKVGADPRDVVLVQRNVEGGVELRYEMRGQNEMIAGVMAAVEEAVKTGSVDGLKQYVTTSEDNT
jgi:hypothetical protein